MAKYIETLDSVEASLAKHFKATRETNIHVDRHVRYKFGYGADLETIYLTDKVKLVGIMFCHPDSELARSQIIPRLEYLHYRSGEDTDLFWAGYGALMKDHVPVDVRPVKVVGGTAWGFSDPDFNAFRATIESKTSWHYSGETDLLLMTARFDDVKKAAYLDFSQTIVCDLDKMMRQGAITSVPRFLEDVFSFGERHGSAEAFDFSDLKLLDGTKKSLWNLVLGLLRVRGYYERTEPFAIRDLRR